MKNTLIFTAITGLLAAFFSLLPTHAPSAAIANKEQVTVITGAEVFDGHEWRGQMDVAFNSGTIIDVGEHLTEKYNDAQKIDATGQYLIPGLIDAHTHAWDNALKDAVKYGVTTELDMFTNTAFASTQRALRNNASDDVQQADLFSAGTLITAPEGHGTEYGFHIDTIENAGQAQEFVKARIDEGSDYIKIVYSAHGRHMPSIDKATLKALIDAAHREGKLAVVHISDYQSARDVIDAGADGLVHGFMDNRNVDELAGDMANNQQFVIPTLSILASMVGVNKTNELVDSFKNVSHLNAEQWRSQLASLRRTKARPQLFANAQRHVGTMHRAGVMILAGSDAPNPGTAHGISLHSELALLVESGLSTDDALKAATSNVAKAFKLTDRGIIAVNKRADFLLLNGDPRQLITNTRKIAKVYKNGFPIDYQTNTSANKKLAAMMFSTFDSDLTSALKTQWYPTTDEQFGGNSTVKIEAINEGENGYLHIIGDVRRKFNFPWAGAFVSFSKDNKSPMDLRNLSGVKLSSKGRVGQYKLMLMSTKQAMRPVEIPFNVSDSWQDQTVSFKAIKPDLLSSVTGMVIVASTPINAFELMIDNVEFVE